MTEPDFGQPAEPGIRWAYDHPDLDPEYPGLDADDTISRAEPHTEWHHDADAGRGGTDPWGGPLNSTAPARWPGSGTYVPDPGPRPQLFGPDDAEPRRASGHRRARRFPWWPVMVTVLLTAVVAAVTMLTFPHGGSDTTADPGVGITSGTGVMAGSLASPAPMPAVTREQAQQVVSHYWKVNNEANQRRSDSLLSTIEAGSSYRMDTGAYRFDRASNPSGNGYVPFAASRTTYYIPRQQADGPYPHWFAVAVTVAHIASPQQPTGSGYLVFSQASPGANWKDVVEPDTVPGSGPSPQIATDSEGYATQVSKGAAGLSVAPGDVSQLTASALDNPGTTMSKVSGTLADEMDQAYWRSRLPAGSTDSDKHQAGAGPVFGLRTKDGGALLFYAATAQLTLAPPSGETFELEIPGYYSSGETLASARVGYIEQFAAYVPPAGDNGWQVVADVSSIASRG